MKKFIKFYDPQQYQIVDNMLICKYVNVLVYFIDACNYSCYYCYNNQPRTNEKIDIASLFKFIGNLANKNNQLNLTIIGGEPTLHPQLVDFCKQITSSYDNIEVQVTTNFTANISTYLKLLALKKCKLSISIHSCQIKNIDNFLKKLNSIPSLFIKKNKIELSLMYEKLYVDNIVMLFKKLSYNLKTATTLQPVYLPMNNQTYQIVDFEYTIKQKKTFNRMFEEICSINIPYYCVYDTEDQTNNMFDIPQKYKENNQTSDYMKLVSFKNLWCNAGIDQLYIHCNGDIAICEDMYFLQNRNIGNIKSKYNLPKTPSKCSLDICGCPTFSKKENVL